MQEIKGFENVQIDDIVNELYPNPLYQLLNGQQLLMQLDQERFSQIQKKLTQQDVEEGMDLLRFVQLTIQVIPSEPEQIIYMTIGLMELFREVSEYVKSTKIKMKDITAFVCDYFSIDDINQQTIKSVKVPFQKTFDRDIKRIREIDLFPPMVLGKNDEEVSHLVNKIQTDSIKHKNNCIKQGIYSSQMKKIITLDQLATNLSVYDLQGTFEYHIQPQSDKQTVILDFAWSNQQQRIGMTMKDHSLCFCEQNDKFKFQKRFSFTAFAPDYQTNIWFLEFNNLWVTTDKSCALNVWNIEKEKLETQYLDTRSQIIVEVQEVVHLKLVAIAVQDKKILLWDFERNSIKLVIKLQSNGVHTLLYSYDYQVILSSGYDNNVNIFQVHVRICDYEMKGNLVGHNSMITAVQIISNTCLIVSTDDFGEVRLWDIRSLKCIQQLHFGNKARMTKIIDISSQNIVAFIGTRLNLLNLQKNQEKSQNSEDKLWIIRAEFDIVRNNFIVCTRRDVRIIDSSNGRVTKILSGLLENPDDEIVCFRSLNQYNNFVIGDLRGRLSIYKYHNCELLFKLQSHVGEVLHLKIDTENNILITAGSDGKILAQQLIKPYQLFREFTNVFEGKAITVFEISVYHNLIFVGCHGNELVVYDYELGRMISILNICSLGEQEEITQIAVITGIALICIASNFGLIYILKFIVKDQKVAYYDVGYEFTILKNIFSKKTQNKFCIRIIVDSEINQNDQDLLKCSIKVGTNQGKVMSYNLKPLMDILQLYTYQHANKRMNYNPSRVSRENFKSGKLKTMKETFDLRKYIKENHQNIYNISSQQTLQFQAHKESIIGMSLFEKDQQFIITTAQDGYMKVWSTEGKQQASLNINHPLAIQWDIPPINIQKFKKQFFYAMKIIQTLNQREQLKDYIRANKIDAYLQSIIESINQKKKQLSQFQDTTIIKKKNNKQKKEFKLSIQSIELPQNSCVILMKDEYSPRDLRQGQKVSSNDLMGKNLKNMEMQKRKLDMQDEWKKELVKQQIYYFKLENELNDQARHQKEQMKQQQQNREINLLFLEEDYHKKFLSLDSQTEEYTTNLKKQLNKKIDPEKKPIPKTSMTRLAVQKSILSEESSNQSRYISCIDIAGKHHIKNMYRNPVDGSERLQLEGSQTKMYYFIMKIKIQFLRFLRLCSKEYLQIRQFTYFEYNTEHIKISDRLIIFEQGIDFKNY